MRSAIVPFLVVLLVHSGGLSLKSFAEEPATTEGQLPQGYPTTLAEAIATSNRVSNDVSLIITTTQRMVNANVKATSTYLNALTIVADNSNILLEGCESFVATAPPTDAAALQNNIRAARLMLKELQRMTEKTAQVGTLL